MSAITTKKIRFLHTKRNGVIYKKAVSDIQDPDIDHVTQFRDTETLNEFILNIDLALTGRYAEIVDPISRTIRKLLSLKKIASHFGTLTDKTG